MRMLLAYKNDQEDINYLLQQLLFNGLAPSQVEDEEFNELTELLSARSRDDRPISAAEFHRRDK